jgi:hypothetical protein
MANPAEESHGVVLGLDSAGRRMVQFRGPGVTADAGLLALCPDIEILPLFADRRMDLLAEGDAVERVEHVLQYLSTMPVICGLPALMRAKPAKGSAKRSMVEWLA